MVTPLILIVDDLPSNRLLVKHLCEGFGYRTAEAADGQEAIIAVEIHSPDLVLLDISMPNMDGYQAAERIKQGRGDDYLPIIFVTAQTSDRSLAQAIAAGGDDFISQPVRSELLESKIRAHLRIRELNQQLLNNNLELSRHNRRLREEADLIGHFFDKALQRNYEDPERIAVHTTPASAFNGDLTLIARGPVGQIYLLFGDFTGHGLQAAMGTLPVQQAFFELTQQGVVVSELARRINGYLHQSMPESMFFAANLIRFEPDYSSMELWLGGMPTACLADVNSEVLNLLESMQMPLGILEENEFDSSTCSIALPQGSRLYLFSDGVTERVDRDGSRIGEERVIELLLSWPKEQRFTQLQEVLAKGGEGGDQQDDLSIVEVVCG